MITKPTLNQSDLNLLKSVFATKKDLTAMESRQDKKYATKTDLSNMEKRQDLKYATKDDLKRLATKEDLKKFATKKNLDDNIEDLRIFFAKYFQHIQLEELLNDHSERINKLEQKAAFL